MRASCAGTTRSYEAPAAVPHARSVGHARDAGARPADPQQRAARRRRRPDAVAGAERVHARRHHRRPARTSSPCYSFRSRYAYDNTAVHRRRRGRGGRRRRAVRRAACARGVRAARHVALPVGEWRSRCGRRRRAAAHARTTSATCRSAPTATSCPRPRWTPPAASAAASTTCCAGCARGSRPTPHATRLAVRRAAQGAVDAAHADADLARAARLGRHALLRLRLRLAAAGCRRRVQGVAHRHAGGHVLVDDPAAGPQKSASSS